MERKIMYMLMPLFAAFAIFAGSSMLYADVGAEGGKAAAPAAGIDRAALKAEIIEELRAEMLEEARAERALAPPAAAPEVSQSAISAAVSSALEETGILSGMFQGTTVGGFIDTNFMYNLRHHGENDNGSNTSGRNRTNILNFVGENEDNSFVVENFAMFLDKAATDEHPVGWQMHTYWGEKAQRITFAGPGNDTTDTAEGGDDVSGTARRFALVTANLTWNAPIAGRTVPITMGKMYTWIGYELVENIGNPNYSHSQTYNNAIPFTHTGASIDVSEFLPSDKWGLTLYYVNGWDTYIDNNEGKSFGTYLTWQPNDDFFISLATIYGPEGWGSSESDNTMMYDIVATYSLPQVEKLSLGFNWDHGYSEDTDQSSLSSGLASSPESGAHWWAAVGYAMYDFTDNQQGALRYEYFDDQDGAKFFGYSLWTITYTHNITLHENLLIRPEIRYNKYNVVDVDEQTHNTGDGGGTFDDEFIIGVGAEYVF